tara:strand:- start:818 stop:1138 length:321 start_codon:yes stop_codon:yes gene_type:complete
MADAMSMESNRTETDIPEEKIESVMKESNLSYRDAIEYILSLDETKKAEEGESVIMESKASGGLVGGQKKLDKNKDGKISGADFKILRSKNYAYGGRVAKSSAEKS